MTELETARKHYLEAEKTLARLKGEAASHEDRMVEARQALAELGVPEDGVKEHLDKLKAEEIRIRGQIAIMEEEVQNIMDSKGR